MVGDRSKGREKSLGMTRGFETAHGSFTLSGRLMRVFGSIIQAFVLAMLNAGQSLFLGSGIAGQFIGHDHTWNVLESFER
jgi:hypothetical protein